MTKVSDTHGKDYGHDDHPMLPDRHSHHRQHAVEHHDHMQGGTANAMAYEPHPSYPLEAGAKRAVNGPDGNKTADRGMQKRGQVIGQSKIVRATGRGR